MEERVFQRDPTAVFAAPGGLLIRVLLRNGNPRSALEAAVAEAVVGEEGPRARGSSSHG